MEDDVFFFQRAFEQIEADCTLHVVDDGEKAIKYLSGEGAYSDRQAHPFPSLIILDLKLPRRNGFEVLRWVRRQPAMRTVPVLILSSSNQSVDIDHAYELGANTYFVKPNTFDQLDAMVRSVSHYWFQQSTFPYPPNLHAKA